MALNLKLHTQPEVPLEADCICPDKLQSLENNEISSLILFHGNRQVQLGDFFDCNGVFDGEIVLLRLNMDHWIERKITLYEVPPVVFFVIQIRFFFYLAD